MPSSRSARPNPDTSGLLLRQLFLDAERCLRVDPEHGMVIAIDSQRYSLSADDLFQQEKVATAILLVAEHGVGNRAGGVVNRADQGQAWASPFQPTQRVPGGLASI